MTVSLIKGQRINLNKETGKALAVVAMGLGWDILPGNRIDLDASALVLDAQGKLIETVYFGHKRSNDGAIVHTGDNLTGAGAGDDETINVDLNRLSERAAHVVFTVNNFTGQSFNVVSNAYCRLVDKSNNQEVARYNLSSQGGHTALIMTRLYKKDGDWRLQAVGELTNGRTAMDLVPAIQASL